MSGLLDKRPNVSCEIKEDKHNRWKEAISWSERNPYFGIAFNDTLINNTFLSTRPFNISLYPLQQQCTVKKKAELRNNDTYCSATIKPECQVMQNYISDLKCPFSDSGRTDEECECIGLNKNVNEMKINDPVNCTCMHDNGRYTMKNKGADCSKNYLFTKECVVDQILITGPDTFRLNCTFINCSSSLENEFFNAVSDTHKYESCMDVRSVKIVPNITDKKRKVTTTKKTPKLSSTKATVSTTSISRTSSSAQPATTIKTTPTKRSTTVASTKSDDTSLIVEPTYIHSTSVSTDTSTFEFPSIKSQQSQQLSSGSLAGIMIFLLIVFSAFCTAGFLTKTIKGKNLRKRLKQRSFR